MPSTAQARRLSDLFPGPRPFTEDEKDLFFGRHPEQANLRSLLQAYRTVLLHAQSGAGKTSLVTAGLFPALKLEGVGWNRGRCNCALAGAATASLNNVFAAALVQTTLGPKAPGDSLKECFSSIEADREYILVLDQFEEIFTTSRDRWQDREPFFQQLSDLLEFKPRLRLLFVIREEYVSRLEPYAYYLPEQFQIRLFLERLRFEQAKDAVREPFSIGGVQFEKEALLDALINDLRREKLRRKTERRSKEALVEYIGEFVEPVQLQVVCRTLAIGLETAGIRTITNVELKEYGDPDQSLVSFYDTSLGQVANEERISPRRLRSWFGNSLITSGGTRGMVFMGLDETEGLPNKVVRSLESAHLVRSEERAGGVWYELTHDRLLGPIKDSNFRWKKRRERIILSSFAAFFAIVCLLLVWILRPSKSSSGIDEARTRTEGQAEGRQQTAQEIFTSAIVLNGSSVEDQQVQRTVADALANYLGMIAGDRSESSDRPKENLQAALEKAAAANAFEALTAIDRALEKNLFPGRAAGVLAWPPQTEDVRQIRRAILAKLSDSTMLDQKMREYICGHNAAIVALSVKGDEDPSYDVGIMKKAGFPDAFAGKLGEPQCGRVPVIVDYFLSCDEAEPLLKDLNAQFKRGSYVISYTGNCPAASRCNRSIAPYRSFSFEKGPANTTCLSVDMKLPAQQ